MATVVDTRKVSGRRKLRFERLEDILADARQMAAVPTRNLGNWTLSQVCQHLGTVMFECTVPRAAAFKVPLKLRILGRLARGRLLRDGLPSGFRLPPEGAKVLVPPPVSMEEGMATLERGLATLAGTNARSVHPVFGGLNVKQWNLFHLRHSEMHLSFIVPE